MLLPFQGYLLQPNAAFDTVAPPYDALSPQQRLQYAIDHPKNFLNAIRSQGDYTDEQRPNINRLLKQNADWIQRQIDSGIYVPTRSPSFMIYRLMIANHSQIGIIGEVPISHYLQNQIKPHENTRESKENELSQFVAEVGIMSSPVNCAYKQDVRINEWTAGITSTKPYIDYTSDNSPDQTRHTLWRISDTMRQTQLAKYLADIDEVYITDGHHRSAALVRFHRNNNTSNPRLLTILFPDNQLRILPYHRRVQGFRPMADAQQLYTALGKDFILSPIQSPQAPLPNMIGSFTMLVARQWSRLQLREIPADSTPAVERLDATILQKKILQPLLGIDNPRTSSRLSYVPGNLSNDRLATDTNPDDVLFLLRPPTIGHLMEIADSDQVMPPKSTWFDPKIQSGFIISYPLRNDRP